MLDMTVESLKKLAKETERSFAQLDKMGMISNTQRESIDRDIADVHTQIGRIEELTPFGSVMDPNNPEVVESAMKIYMSVQSLTAQIEGLGAKARRESYVLAARGTYRRRRCD